MSAMASQITGVPIVCLTFFSGVNQSKHQSSAPLSILRGIHRWPVDSPHKEPVMRKMFLVDDVIMPILICLQTDWFLLHCWLFLLVIIQVISLLISTIHPNLCMLYFLKIWLQWRFLNAHQYFYCREKCNDGLIHEVTEKIQWFREIYKALVKPNQTGTPIANRRSSYLNNLLFWKNVSLLIIVIETWELFYQQRLSKLSPRSKSK